MESETAIYSFGKFTFDKSKHILNCEGEEVPIAPRDAEVLLVLLENAGTVVEKEVFFDTVWEGSFVEDGNLTVAITHLRKHFREFDEGEELIRTIPRRGYRFTEKVTVEYSKNEPNTDSKRETHQKAEPIFIALPEDFVNDEEIKAEPVSNEKGLRSYLKFVSNFFTSRIYLKTILLSVLVSVISLSVCSDRAPRKNNVRLAVLPFKDLSEFDEEKPQESSAERQKYLLRYAVADRLISRFDALNNVDAISLLDTSIYSTEDISLSSDDVKSAADYVMEGSYSEESGKIYICVKLINTRNWQVVMDKDFQIADEGKSLIELRDEIVSVILSTRGINEVTLGARLPVVTDQIGQNTYLQYLEGIDHLIEYDYLEAIEDFKFVVESSPNNANSWYLLSRAYSNQAFVKYGDSSLYEKANEALKRAIEIEPENVSFKQDEIFLLIARRHWREAIQKADEFYASNPLNQNAYFVMSTLYLYVGPLSESTDWMNKLLDRAPEMRMGFSQMIYEGDYDRFESRMWNAGNSPGGNYMFGYLNLNKGENKKAIEYFDIAYNLDDKAFYPQIGKGISNCLKKQYADGDLIFATIEENLARHVKVDPEGLFWLSQAYAVCGKTENALTTLRRAIDAGFLPFEFYKDNKFFESVRDTPKFNELIKIAKQKREKLLETVD